MDLEKILSRVNTISSSRNYWLVRAMGGKYYHEFLSQRYIAIGYNEINLHEIEGALSQEEPNKYLTELISTKLIDLNLKDKYNASYAAGQLLTFCTKIKIGDIILTPSSSGIGFVSIGIVSSTVRTEVAASQDEKICQFSKRISVNWIDQYNRYKLNPYLQKIFNSQHIVNDINKYSELIESLINDIYIKDDEAHLTLRVKRDDDIPMDAFTLPNDIMSLVDEFMRFYNITGDNEVITMKMIVQSPGDIKIKSKSAAKMMCAAAIIGVLTGGGHIRCENIGLDMSTDGLLKAASLFLDARVDRIIKKEKSVLELQSMAYDNEFKKIELEKAKLELELLKKDTSVSNIVRKMEVFELETPTQLIGILKQ